MTKQQIIKELEDEIAVKKLSPKLQVGKHYTGAEGTEYEGWYFEVLEQLGDLAKIQSDATLYFVTWDDLDADVQKGNLVEVSQ